MTRFHTDHEQVIRKNDWFAHIYDVISSVALHRHGCARKLLTGRLSV